MTTALFIYYTTSWQRLADVVLPVAQAYCDKWGYKAEFRCSEREPNGTGYFCMQADADVISDCTQVHFGEMKITSAHDVVGYHKMLHLRRLINTYDLIWILDLDALITNPDIPFHEFCEDPYDHDLFITEDTHGINCGSFIIRGNLETQMFIDFIIDKFGDAPEEQTVFNRLRDYWPTVRILPHPSINSYLYTEYLYDWDAKVGAPMPGHEQGRWQPGDLCLHLPGVEFERRIEVFEQIIKATKPTTI
jgi:hypothetical protein